MVSLNTEYKFIRKLIKLQRQHKYTNLQFANKLNVSNSLWTKIKRGEKRIGIAVLSGLCRVYPEYNPDILEFLRNNNNHEH